ncbi:MAG: type VI secretion system contractile sheath large subunit [Gammaproteobacteria bacterium]|nr:type VI secretion system contractile sheath large subunit [Gammaproteobacteria bacterium]
MASPTPQSGDRVNLTYQSKTGDRVEDVELPFRVMVVSDLTRDNRSEIFEDQDAVRLNSADIGVLFQKLKPELRFRVADQLRDEGGDLQFQINFQGLDDFAPEKLINAIPALSALLNFNDRLSRLTAGDELQPDKDIEFIEKVLESESISIDEIKRNAESFGWLISSIEEKICRQIDTILHHPDFQQMESAWRSIDFLLQRTDFSENCELSIVNVSKQGLMDDFEDAPDIFQSGFYQLVYSEEYGQFGGRPYGLIVGDYEFNPGVPDIKLLQRIASVSAVAHAPFLASASADFFDIDSYSKFSKLRDLASIFEQPRYTKWNSFRATSDARYIGLTMPGFLLRQPHDISIGGLHYLERSKDTDSELLWGNGGFALASRLLDSFAQFRWCLNSTGKVSGLVEGLTMKSATSNSLSQRIPTRFLLTDKRESEVVEQGFIPLSVHKGDDTAAFYSAYSVQSVKKLNDGENDLSVRLAAQIPYLLIVGRISQYLKIMQRENIGSWTNRREIDQELNNWLRQYVSDMDNPAPGVRSRRPLRKAEIKVREVEGKHDWYLTRIEITPHLKFMGKTFSLSETSKLEKN